jgi:hypothetical protein
LSVVGSLKQKEAQMRILKRVLLGGAVAAVVAGTVLAPAPAAAEWRGHHGWGWHAPWHGARWHAGWHHGWGWRGGVYAVGYHWIPGHYTPWGAWIPAHWGY